MGKVFSWDELVKGQTPKLESFGLVRNKIALELEKCPAIVGAVTCGSVLRGDHSIRSDFDCLVVYDGKSLSQLVELLQGLNNFSKQLYVPVEFIPLDIRLARCPPIEYSFGLHLEWAARNGGCIKKNPIPMLTLDESDLEHEIRYYVRLKLSKLTKRWIKYPDSTPDERFRFLQKVLEAPVYIARKIIRWRRIDISFDDSKRAIKRIFSEHFSESEFLRLFNEVVGGDTVYTEKLLQQFGNPDEAQYAEALAKIERVVPNVLEFLRLSTILVNGKDNLL